MMQPDPKVQAVQQALTNLTQTESPTAGSLTIDGLSSEIKNHLASMAWIEVRFAIAFLYSNNRTDAANDVGLRREYTYNSARQDGDDFEGRVDKLIELMKQAAVLCATQLIQHATIKAAGVLIRSLDEPNANTRIRAAKLVMEYGVGKPVARTITEGKVEHEHHIPKIYAVDPAWPGINVEHVEMPDDAPATNEASFMNDVIEGEATYPDDPDE